MVRANRQAGLRRLFRAGIASSSHTAEQFHRIGHNNILRVRTADTSGKAKFFSKSICLQLSCRSHILLCIHFTQFPHFCSHSFNFFNFVHTVKPHGHRHRGACAQWVWLGPMTACNVREDGRQLSHPYGISWVILHWQWQSALYGLSGPWAGQTREWC